MQQHGPSLPRIRSSVNCPQVTSCCPDKPWARLRRAISCYNPCAVLERLVSLVGANTSIPPPRHWRTLWRHQIHHLLPGFTFSAGRFGSKEMVGNSSVANVNGESENAEPVAQSIVTLLFMHEGPLYAPIQLLHPPGGLTALWRSCRTFSTASTI